MNQGAVVWFTGLPASGKSTLARELRGRLTALGVASCLLDGDDVRACLVPTPGYDEAGRAAFYETLSGLAAALAGQGLVVLVAATAHRRSFRQRARQLAPAFVEVFVDTGRAVCEARDPKGLYRAARQDRASTLPGVGDGYEPPLAPEVTVTPGQEAVALDEVVGRLRTLR